MIAAMPTALLAIARQLARATASLSFAPPVTHVYNPLEYAWRPHAAYLERYGRGRKEVLWLGMNPGPFGMAQTGVPFGDVAAVRDFLGIEAEVGAPARVHPKRPIQGFACPRGEVSGRRLWGFVAENFGSAGVFFRRNLVVNYCPLVFMDEGGRNLTPDKLPADERARLFSVCDAALAAMAAQLSPRLVVAVGHFAQARARAALGEAIEVRRIPHPSPANPLANRGWAAAAARALGELAAD